MNKINLFLLLVAITFICKGQDYVKFKSNGKVGFKTADGKIIIPAKYDDALDRFTEGLVGVRLKDKWGYIDSIEKVVVPFKYLEVSNFLFDVKLARIFKGTATNNKVGYINNLGQEIIPPIYDDLDERFFNNIVMGCINEKCGAINKNGKILIPLMYEGYMKTIGGKFIAKKNGFTGVVDSLNKEVIQFDYDNIRNYFLDLFIVQSGGKYGLFDNYGKKITDCIWDNIGKMDEKGNIFRLTMGKDISYITKSGKKVDKYGQDL